jgi:hypothetical protein
LSRHARRIVTLTAPGTTRVVVRVGRTGPALPVSLSINTYPLPKNVTATLSSPSIAVDQSTVELTITASGPTTGTVHVEGSIHCGAGESSVTKLHSATLSVTAS